MPAIEILDSGMGTEILSNGVKLPPYIWSAHTNIVNPDLVYQIHKKNISHGADYITTNTFRATTRSFIKTGLSKENAREMSYKSFTNAIEMAKKAAAGTSTKILGSIAPLEDCYTPPLYPGDKDSESEFIELAVWFTNCGIDTILLETMNSIPEILSCIRVLSKYNVKIWLSLNLMDQDHILSGEKINLTLESISEYQISALMINCNSIEKTKLSLENIKALWNGKWGIYPNLGLGEPAPDGIISNFSSDDDFMNLSRDAADLGASFLGGCCGTNYKHIHALSKEFK